MASNKVFVGSELKLNLHIDPIGDKHMQDYDFKVEIYCQPSKVVTLVKDELGTKRTESKDDYLLMVDTTQLGPGKVKLKVTAEVPDLDFVEDNTRTEVVIIDTGITIV